MEPIGILAIQGDFHAHAAALRRLGIASREVRKATELCGLSCLILPGGESTTMLKVFDQENLWEPLSRFAQEKPLFGTCAGAILMARTVENPAQRSLGLLDIKIRRNAYGRQIHSSVRRLDPGSILFSRGGENRALEAVLIRAPVIVEVAPSVDVLATLDSVPVLVRQGHWLAATFHPELTDDTRVHAYFLEMVQGGGR